MDRLVKKVNLPILGEMYVANVEDINLEGMQALQEPLKRLYDYEEKEEKGLLLHLPCRVGDVVYEVVKGCSHPTDCRSDCKFCLNDQAYVTSTEFTIDMLTEVGKTIFLTQEQAEQGLENIGRISMTRRELFLKYVTMYDIDEVWINFQNPFEGTHTSCNEKVLIYKRSADIGSSDMSDAAANIPEAFGGDMESTDCTTDLVSLSFPGKYAGVDKLFAEYKKDCYLLYRKGDDIIG